jgi:hypothetical protein
MQDPECGAYSVDFRVYGSWLVVSILGFGIQGVTVQEFRVYGSILRV